MVLRPPFHGAAGNPSRNQDASLDHLADGVLGTAVDPVNRAVGIRHLRGVAYASG
jgi:hypothetical protein